MGRLAAGNLTETVSLTLAGPAVTDGRGGKLPGGGAAPGWPKLRRARVRVLAGAEALRLGQVLGTTLLEATIRYEPEATTQTGLAWQGRTYNVRAVTHDPWREFTTLTCADNGR